MLNLAESFLLNTARIWMEMSLEQRQRFQKVLFPEGIELMANGVFRTAVTCPVFSMLQPEMTPHERMAALMISNWNQIVEFLKQIATLQAVTT